jgi:hypothetical protein
MWKRKQRQNMNSMKFSMMRAQQKSQRKRPPRVAAAVAPPHLA